MASTAGAHSPPQPGYASPPQQPYAAYLSGAQQQLYQQAAANVRPGTLPPGVCVKIGEHEVTIERFLSEGGFAHVYVVRSSQPIPSPSGSSEVLHVLKRVAVPDKPTLKEVRWEVDVMKLLRGHKHIVNLIEASAAPIPGTTGYEVFILMEYCSGGGIIDMMNTRLQNRLTEAEILKIFSDVVEGVCWMHTRNPPLMHRDLKVENILLAGPDFYKVCDFGSATTPKRAPQSMQEIQALEAELNKTTTLQYRAPEMCDVWSRKEVALPADIWALGVLLYKLCFYTTPFEEQGPLAILNVQYKMPSYPNYSQEIRSLIASMLVEPIDKRPTAWQVHQQVCRLRGVKPNRDYQQDTLQVHQPSRHASLNGAVSPSFSSRPTSGAGHAISGTSSIESRIIDDAQQDQRGISPMRRGRPGKSNQNSINSQPSNLHSEWHVPSQSAPHNSSGDTAVPHHVIPGSHNPYATHDNGFTDSFTPSVPALTGDRSHAGQQAPMSQTTGSKTASATAALFEELSNPGSTIKPQPTLASLAAERSGQRPLTGPKVQQYMQQFSQPSSQPSTSTQGLRRVSPGKPLGPRSALSVPGPTSQSRTPSYTAEGERAKEVDEGAQIAKTALSPPLKPPKPKLVSRGSQTSPTLLNEWKQKELANMKGQPPSRTPSLTVQAPPRHDGTQAYNPAHDQGAEIDRFPSIDDWESKGFSPPTEPTALLSTSPLPLTSSEHHQIKDHLDTGLGGLNGLAPVRTVSHTSKFGTRPYGHASSSSSASPSVSSVSQQSELAAVQYSARSGSPSRRLETSSSSSSDSEEDDGPEEPTGHHYGTTTPPVAAHVESAPIVAEVTKSPSIASGNAQLSPRSAPPILAPKPKLGGISSIVSRYENISTSDSTPPEARRPDPSGSNSVNKPTKPPKPAFSGPSGQSSLEQAPSLPTGSSADAFHSRYPSLSGNVRREPPSRGHVEYATPDSASNSRSQASYSASESVRTRPQSMQWPAAKPSLSTYDQSAPNATNQKHSAVSEEDDEEEYQGVANLRDRWQRMQGSSQLPSADGLNRRATTLGSNRWDRH